MSGFFSHADLKVVDPNFSVLPGGTYNLRFTKAEVVPYGDLKDKERISLALTVTGDPEYSGRRLFESFFENDYSLKALKRIEGACGIPQDTGEPLASWLDRLVSEGAEVKVPVLMEDDVIKDKSTGNMVPNSRTMRPDGSAAPKNRVDWKHVAPVG